MYLKVLFLIALFFGAQALTVKINILQANPQACVLKARIHKSFGLIDTHTSWQEMKEINITSILLKKWHLHAHIILIVSAAWSTSFLTVPLGSAWKQPWLVEMSVCHSTMCCKTLKSLNKLDFTLSYSPCRPCTKLYLSSHHTFAWEWLASPQGHLIWSPCCINTNTHTFIIPVLCFSSGLAVPPVPAIRMARGASMWLHSSGQEQCKPQASAEVSAAGGSHPAAWQPSNSSPPPNLLWGYVCLLNRDSLAWLAQTWPAPS